MRSLVQIICFTHLLSYLQAATDNPRSPKLGPSIAEKPFKIDEDLSLILNGLISKTGYGIDVINLLTLNGMDKKIVTMGNVTDLLTSRTYKQRMQLSDAYKEKTTFDLLQDLNNACPSGCQFDALFTEMKTLMGKWVESSLSKSKDWAYMSILCTSSGSRLKEINDFSYKQTSSGSPYEDSFVTVTVKFMVNGRMRQQGGKDVLTAILTANPLRNESGVDQSKIEKQVESIPKNHKECETSNVDLLDLMTKESFEQIKAVDDAYKNKNNGETVLSQIDKYCKGDVKEAYRRIVFYSVDQFGYFADQLQSGLTDKHSGWIRDALPIVAYTRCEIDLKDIEAAFHTRYQKTVLEAMADWSSPSKDLGTYIIYSVYRGNTGDCP